jgi:hypothetical protein
MAAMVRPKGKPAKIFAAIMGTQKPKYPKYTAINVQLPTITTGYKQFY